MGNYISKVTPVRPVFGKKLDESNIIVGEEMLETPNQSELKQEQSPNKANARDSLKADNHESLENDDEDDQIDGAHTNGHTNGFTNGQSNGHSSSNNHSNGHSDGTNGNSISNDNGHSNGADEELDEEDELNDEQPANGKLNKSDLKSKKDDKQYSNKRTSLINEVDPVEPQPEEEDLEQFEAVVGRKRKGRKSATPKKQYKKRKNNLLSDLQKVNELVVDE